MRLIYSGKLLKEETILMNVLRQFEGQETHTIHLVFTPKASSLRKDTSKTFLRPHTSTDVTDSEQTDRANVQPAHLSNLLPSSFAENSFSFTNNSNVSQNSSESVLAQQYALQNWMHQTYQTYQAQYINQYMNM